GGSRRSESRPAAWHPRFAAGVHDPLYPGRGRVDRDGAGAIDRRERAAGVGLRAARDACLVGIYLAGRGCRADLGAAGVDARAVAGIFRRVARRPAAASLQPDSSEVSHAVHTDHADRNRSRNYRGAAADPGNRGTDEYRDAVRVRAGMLRRLDPAPRRAGLEAPVPHAAGAAGADFGRRLLPLPDGESAAGHVDSFFRVDGNRAGYLLQLRP